MKVFPLRRRLLLLLALLSSLMLVALGTFAYVRAKNLMLRGAEAAVALQADTLANTIVEQYAGEYSRTVAGMRHDPRIQACLSGRPCDREELLNDWGTYRNLRPDVFFIYLSDNTGRILLLSPDKQLPPGYDGSVRPWFRRAVENPGRTVWTNTYPEIFTHQTVVSTVSTVNEPASEKMLGVLGIDIATDGLRSILARVALPQGSGLLLLTADGYAITDTGPGTELARRMGEPFLRSLADAASPHRSSTYTDMGGEPMLVSVRTVPGPDWQLVLMVPQAELLHGLAPIRTGTVLAIGGLLLLFAVMFSAASTGASGKLHQLADYMHRVARGDFTVHTLFTGKDEFGAFNRHLNELVIARRDAEAALRNAEQQHRELVENAPIGIFRTTWDGRMLVLNQHGAAMLGFRDVAHARALLDDSMIPLYAEPVDRNAMQDGLAVGEVVTGMRLRWYRRDGEGMWVSVYARKTGPEDAPEVEGFFLDVTGQVEDTRRLEQLATTDELTGVANRRHFMTRLEDETVRAQRYGRPLSVLLLDADHFKTINDTWGHEAGDVVLRHLTDIMSASVRENDLIGRLGGEEFGVLLPETGLERALRTAERIRAAVEDSPVAVRDVWVGCTVSVGAAQYRGAHDSPDDLVRRADQMLMRAKESGRNRVCAQLPAPSSQGRPDGQ